MNKIKYHHVDVFSKQPMSGNGLAVVFPQEQLDFSQMLRITQEFRQFETIFVYPELDGDYPVRIFTVEEELDFAGHPMLGAAAVIHQQYKNDESEAEIVLSAGGRQIFMNSKKNDNYFSIEMNQGKAEFINSMNVDDIAEIVSALSLSPSDIHPGYPIEVVSTGLPYLLIPVKCPLDRVKISSTIFEALLHSAGAKFAYVFNPVDMECRTWDNAGLVEDIATGSAAGPLCAYLVKNAFRDRDEIIEINQGRFTGRPSLITGRVSGAGSEVFINGDVSFFGEGEIRTF